MYTLGQKLNPLTNAVVCFLLALQFLLIVQPLKHVALTYYHALQCVLKKKQKTNGKHGHTHLITAKPVATFLTMNKRVSSTFIERVLGVLTIAKSVNSEGTFFLETF